MLITSRDHGWRTVGDIVEVPVFRRAESTGYLMRRAPHITADEADEVAVEFQDLPLQMAHAAALLGELGSPYRSTSKRSTAARSTPWTRRPSWATTQLLAHLLVDALQPGP